MKPVSSFIFNFKKYIARACSIAATMIMIILIGKGINYCLVDDTFAEGSSWERTLFHDFYHQRENIDNLYLGSSHVFHNIIPQELDRVNGKNNYNLSTPLQPLNSSYYLLKEAHRENEISHVYLEMFYTMMTDPIGYEGLDPLTRNWNNLYQMPLSLNKIEYMLEMSSRKYYGMTFFESKRYADKIFDTEYVAQIIKKKLGEKYRNYEYKHGGKETYFVEKGYMHTEDRAWGDMFCVAMGKTIEFQENPLTEDPEEYLRKIIEYCQDNDIKITLFTSPMCSAHMLNIENYDVYVNAISGIANEYGINYYDFNLCNQKYLDIDEPRFYTIDGLHMNRDGADVFSPFLGEVMLAEEEQRALPEDMFCMSYSEKVQTMREQILGMRLYKESDEAELTAILTNEEDKDSMIVYRIVSVDTCDKKVEYCVYTKLADGEVKEVIYDWSTNDYFVIPKDDKDTLYIDARVQGETKTYETMIWF